MLAGLRPATIWPTIRNPPAGVLINTSGTGAIQDHPPLSNFAPRVGFAYQVNSKLVVRGGAGMFYDRIGADRFVHAVEQGNPYAATLDYSGSAAAPFTIQNPFPTNIPLGTVCPALFQSHCGLPCGTTTGLACTSGLSVPFLNQIDPYATGAPIQSQPAV